MGGPQTHPTCRVTDDPTVLTVVLVPMDSTSVRPRESTSDPPHQAGNPFKSCQGPGAREEDSPPLTRLSTYTCVHGHTSTYKYVCTTCHRPTNVHTPHTIHRCTADVHTGDVHTHTYTTHTYPPHAHLPTTSVTLVCVTVPERTLLITKNLPPSVGSLRGPSKSRP